MFFTECSVRILGAGPCFCQVVMNEKTRKMMPHPADFPRSVFPFLTWAAADCMVN